MQPEDKKLENLLALRPVPPMRPDLAQRIIRAAGEQPQRQGWWQALTRLCVDLHCPKPAYALTALLLLGFALGFGAGDEFDSPDEWQEAYYAEESTL